MAPGCKPGGRQSYVGSNPTPCIGMDGWMDGWMKDEEQERREKREDIKNDRKQKAGVNRQITEGGWMSTKFHPSAFSLHPSLQRA